MVRVFQTHGGSLSEIPQGRLVSIQWTDTLRGAPKAVLRLTAEISLTPANVPDTILIVPSFRESLAVPVYGPFEMNSDYSYDGLGYGISGVIGEDFATDFAGQGSTSVLQSITAQIEGYASSLYEPFLGWTAFPSETDGPNVAKLGEGFAALAVAPLFAVGEIKDLESLLGRSGLLGYTLVEWPEIGRAATHRIAVWPLHPLFHASTDDFGSPQTNWAVQPRIGAVRTWTEAHLPLSFYSPNISLPNTVDLTDAIIEQFPDVRAPHLLNAPHGGPRPSYRTRRIDVSYRLLGIDERIALYHTGVRTPALPLTPQSVISAAGSKMTEELTRWNLQNTAAYITLTRVVPDDWSLISDAMVAPQQVIKVNSRWFPETWDDGHREFVVREVQHIYAPGRRQSYRQRISGTLWQGPFERLEAES